MSARTASTFRNASAPIQSRIGALGILRHLSYKDLAAALSLGLALRVFFVIHFPFYAGDTRFYDELARNLLDHGVYGLFVRGQLTPVDMRMPGYPLFLSGLYAALGRSSAAVMFFQVFIDLITCVLTAVIAGLIAPADYSIRVATVALWMATLCPFTANFSAALLTEGLATFLTTLAVLAFLMAFTRASTDSSEPSDHRGLYSQAASWLLTGVLVGLGTLVRPETPLFLLAAGLLLAVCWRQRANWKKLFLAISWMSVGLILTLTPWAARNARALGRIEFLAPRYAQTYGDFIPHGFYSWTGTWMVRFKDAYLVTWKLGKQPISMEDLPASAFDSDAERVRVKVLLDHYNSDLQMSPLLDREFATLAYERKARRPIRSYIGIPLARMWAIWFTPRIALLPYSGKLWPPKEMWQNDRTAFATTIGFGILNFMYLVLAVIGACRFRKQPIVAFLMSLVLIRTIFLTQLQTVEPRYVIVCYPVILALGALAWSQPAGRLSARADEGQRLL
jgi:4-amino-4-deoxy-L-arabinose transferase-like glycosyltransferase